MGIKLPERPERTDWRIAVNRTRNFECLACGCQYSVKLEAIQVRGTLYAKYSEEHRDAKLCPFCGEQYPDKPEMREVGGADEALGEAEAE